jgi:branched-chain amino acid transport system substrate-binding protein
MTSWNIKALLFALLASSAHAQESAPLVVGAVVSQSGQLAELADGYRKALLQWQEEVNASGGLLNRRVELRILDDASDAIRVGELYKQLIAGRADVLVGPYGSAATLMGAAEAESARRIMVAGAAPSGSVFKRAPRYVFQSGIAYAGFALGLLDLAKTLGLRRLFIVARDDIVPAEMATGLRDAALAKGLTTGELHMHSAGAMEFESLVLTAAAEEADAWVAFGEAPEAAEMVKTFKRMGYAPKLFFARGAADPRLIGLLGQDAEYSLAALEYDPRVATPANAQFVKAFRDKWGAAPGLSAAQGYAAATVLGEALRRAGSTDQEKLRAVLASHTLDTVLGPYKADPKTGQQTAASAPLVQILKGRRELVWPPGQESAAPVFPYPQWSERKYLKTDRR